MNHLRQLSPLTFLRALTISTTLLGAACSDGEVAAPAPASGCAFELHGACVGVTQASCSGEACTVGVSCGASLAVGGDAELAGVLAAAQPGDCVLLGPGEFGAVTVPGGVSLIGRGVDQTRVLGVNVAKGSGSVLRGLRVEGTGVRLDAADDARIEEVRVSGSSAAGVDVGFSQRALLTRSEVSGAAGLGARVADGSLTIADSVIAEGAGPGVVATCTGGCDCTAAVTLSIDGTLITGNSHVGLYASGANVQVTGSIVSETSVLGLEPNSGGGVVAAECSSLSVTGSEVRDNDYFGVLVDSSTGSLGAGGEENGIIIYGNVMGIFLQGLGTLETSGFRIDNALVESNAGVSLGIGGGAKGIIIYGTQVKQTLAHTLPVAGGGAQEVGDGVLWAGTAQVSIDGLTVSASARQGVLIDGPVAGGSTIANLTLTDGDEAKGLVQQSVQVGDPTPAIGAATPALTSESSQVFAVPQPPAAPSP
jgi:hypothetical protein